MYSLQYFSCLKFILYSVILVIARYGSDIEDSSDDELEDDNAEV